MTLDELAIYFVKEYEEGSHFYYKDYIYNLNDDSLAVLEGMLLQKIPNLIITHSDRDSDDDIRRQLVRIRAILDCGEMPYFIDFSREKKFVKRKIKI